MERKRRNYSDQSSGRTDRRRRVIRESSFTNFSGRHTFASAISIPDATTAAVRNERLRSMNESLAADRTTRTTAQVEMAGNEVPSDQPLITCTIEEAPHPDEGELRPTPTTQPILYPDLFQGTELVRDDSSECVAFHESPVLPHEERGDTCEEDIGRPASLSQKEMRMGQWSNMLACLFVSGTTRFTALQYKIIADALQTANPEIKLPTYKTVRTSTRTHLLDMCFPKSDLHNLQNIAHAPRRDPFHRPDTTTAVPVPDPRCCVRMVKPSDWAKLDVATLHTYSEIFEHRDSELDDYLTIERSMLIQDRRRAINKTPTLWARKDHAIIPTKDGTCISLSCESYPRRINDEDVSSHGWPLQSGSTSRSITVSGIVGPIWYVRNNDARLRVMTQRRTTGTEAEQAVQMLFSSRAAIPRMCGRKILHVGDICAIIRRQRSSSTNDIVCVLISSFVNTATGEPSDRLVWINGAAAQIPNTNIHILSETVVTRIPDFMGDLGANECVLAPPHSDQNSCVRNKGKLDDGTDFVVYRMALYADGFKQLKSLSDTRSVGGFYMLPLGLPQASRRSSSAARVLSLLPAGQSLNDALNLIVDDVVNAATSGVDGIDPYGRTVKIFLDPVAFFGDYPAVSAATDVLGHTANAFCPLCTMSRRKGSRNSEVMYTTSTHSRRLSFMRCDDRMNFIRAEGLHNSVRKRLGMKCNSELAARKLPLVHLSHRLDMCRDRVRKTSNGRPVLDPMFDSCLSAAAVPDHLLTGLIKNVLSLCFAELSSDCERRDVELKIMDATSSNNLPTEGSILKWEKNGKYGGLNSMTMSALFCVLLCAAEIFEQRNRIRPNPALPLPAKLQKVVALVYWWPTKTADGDTDVSMFNKTGGHEYYSKLMNSAEAYLESADSYYRKYPLKGKILDKPNSHRLLELCAHTIPNFGHGRLCSEMVLEMVHRCFKDWLETNTHYNSHISAMERAIARDWFGRIASLEPVWTNGAPADREKAEFGLGRLILGEDRMRAGLRGCSLSDFRALLKLLFREPVLSLLKNSSPVNMSWSSSRTWLAAGKIKNPDESEMFTEGKELLHGYVRIDDAAVIQQCRRAIFTCVDKFGGRTRSYEHNVVHVGDVLSVLVQDLAADCSSSIVTTAPSGNGVIIYLAVGSILHVPGHEGVWVMVRALRRVGHAYRSMDTTNQLLRLDTTVRRVAVIHVCDSSCVTHPARKLVQHSASVLHGGLYKVLGRAEGYPPHMG